MTSQSMADLWHSEDLIEVGMQADSLRTKLHPYGIVTYCLGPPETATPTYFPLVVTPGESLNELIEQFEQARELHLPAVQPRFNATVTGTEYLKLVALSRLYLEDIASIQAAPPVVGLKVAQLALRFGADDLGSTDAERSEEAFRSLIRDAGLTPKRRDANYLTMFLS